MARTPFPLIAGAALALLLGQGAGERAHALPMALPHMHAQHGAMKTHTPKLKPPPAPPAEKVKPPEGPTQPFHGLMAAAQTEVRTRLGAPDVARSEGSGAMWTYRLPDCALYIFFRAPKGASADTPARVSGAASGPRVRGQRPLPVNDCIAEAMGRQGGGSASAAGGAS
jgi:hypothetical protein